MTSSARPRNAQSGVSARRSRARKRREDGRGGGGGGGGGGSCTRCRQSGRCDG
eukprot:ctg_4702.g824